MTGTTPLPEALAQLRQRFVATSGNTIAAFRALADQLQLAPTAPAVLETLRRELHRVRGTAGSYGFHDASRLAGALEGVVVDWSADPALDRERRAAIVRQFGRALGQSIAPGTAAPDAPRAERLLLVELPDGVASPLVTEAMHRGYFVERITRAELTGLVDEAIPRAVIAPVDVPLALPEGIPVVRLQEAEHHAGGSDHPGARVLDARTDPREILLVADAIASHTGMAGATMLVVDDDPAMLDLLRAVGEGTGMFVETRADAEGLLDALDELRPALLLLDVELAGGDGRTLTRQVRAAASACAETIRIGSSAKRRSAREAAFEAGADDFQTKPVVAVEVTRRIARLLEAHRQRLLSRGTHPATGLPLPARTVRAFDDALQAAAGQGAPMAVALIRPLRPPEGRHRSALWHRECALVGAALAVDGVRTGFHDETALLVLFPMDGRAAAARLEAFADASRSDDVPWCAGVAELRPGASPGARLLARSAEEAWLAARDAGVGVHRWEEADAAIAPDVIVVEDDQALADLITFALTARGLTHQVFRTGPAGLEGLLAMRAHERRPVVILDVDLPGLDGFSLFERLRVERPGAFQVVFLSVHASEGDQLRALRAGALDYIAKPVSLRVLLAKIAVWRAQGRAE